MTPSLFYYPKLCVLFWFVSLQLELETYAPAIINNVNLYFPTYCMCNAVAFMHVKNKLKKNNMYLNVTMNKVIYAFKSFWENEDYHTIL